MEKKAKHFGKFGKDWFHMALVTQTLEYSVVIKTPDSYKFLKKNGEGAKKNDKNGPESYRKCLMMPNAKTC